MNNLENYWPLIQHVNAGRNIPFVGMDELLVAEFEDVAQDVTPNCATTCDVVLRLLECFLQVTGQNLSISDVQKKGFIETCEKFMGALYSEKFWNARPKRRFTYARTFLNYVDALRVRYPDIPLVIAKPSGLLKIPQDLALYVTSFESTPCVEEKAYVWRGWQAKNGNGKCIYLQFLPIYARLGREFTDRLHRVYQEYLQARLGSKPIAAKQLALFISSYESELSVSDFKSPSFMAMFWRKFAVYYVTQALKTNGNAQTAISNWHKHFVHFVENYLQPSDLVAAPLGLFPRPPRRYSHPSTTNIRQNADGVEVRTKLLTSVPLKVSDSEALEILFCDIENDLNTVIEWARKATNDMWLRHQRRLEQAKKGTPRKINGRKVVNGEDLWLSDPSNPDCLANACSTYETYGHLHSSDVSDLDKLYPLGRPEMAHYFALPTAGALLPHCALLTALHPIITPSFLENLELYTPSGIRIGFEEANDGKYLVGTKERKNSPSKKEQKIRLNDETSTIVQQIITLTAPLRTYLKNRKDPNWIYLLLGCGEGFGLPARPRVLGSYTSIERYKDRTALEISKWTEASNEYAVALTDRLSISSIRASAGVLIYLKTWDLKKMAEALGHTKSNLHLLDHYLPRPIRDFFQDRWVRIFQQSLIVEALKDSQNLLRATQFKDMEEVNEFMRTHALKNPASRRTNSSTSSLSLDDEVIISVSLGILITLISLQMAVETANRPINALARYWTEIIKRLVRFIDSEECRRVDLKKILAKAREAATPSTFSRMIYE